MTRYARMIQPAEGVFPNAPRLGNFVIAGPFNHWTAKAWRMAGGWAPDGAVQDQIDDTVKDAVSFARARMPSGESAAECEECGEPIPERRREALPGVRTCVQCQSVRDSRPTLSPFNRRGSKDSQLR